MQAFRHIFEYAPAVIPVPEQWQEKHMEVILLVSEETEPMPVGVKALLLKMPDVGQDEDFVRFHDTGREEARWDF
ncbi:MAG: hypothetical protein HQL94_00790 [Magnetococcales bacterium]|nr:hypothetical protein [Magnetococcales bacterium]